MRSHFATGVVLVVALLAGGPCSADLFSTISNVVSELDHLKSLSVTELVKTFKELFPSCWVQKDDATLGVVLKQALETISKLTTESPSTTWGLTCEAALTPEEFRNRFNTKLPPASTAVPAAEPSRRKRQAIPASIDWRTKGYVTPVKNQGQCGSCWAFAAAGALEGRLFAKTGKLQSLSEQNLIDCTVTAGGGGCAGGWITDAYDYVKNNSGIATTAAYPYRAASTRQCAYNAATSAGTVSGFTYVKSTEADLAYAVATQGPIAVVADATEMQYYRGGVLRGKPASVYNHGLLVVGYGSDWLNGKYWIVKNSWGSTWGESGYLRIAKDAGNACGLATAPSYPLA